LNVAGYYDPLLALFDQAVAEQFLRSEYRSLVVSATDVDQMLKELDSYRRENLQKWMDRDKI
jgi:predicted Rossmann-fold nucleotide-binding protein